MLVAVQFPIADGRAFTASPTARLDVPDWPSPRTYAQQFVRRFGQASDRQRGPDTAWVDEKTYCSARRAVRLPTLPSIALPGGRRFYPTGAFRRLLCDDTTAVVRVEVGIASSRRRPELAGLEPGALLSAIDGVLGLTAETYDYKTSTWLAGPLHAQGLRLARLYAMASARKQAGAEKLAALRLVAPGRPLVVVETEPGEVAELPPTVQWLDQPPIGGLDLGFLHLATSRGPVPVWIIAGHHDLPGPLARSLRISLLRLHAGQEVLDLILSQVKAGRIDFQPYTTPGDRLTEYLKTAMREVSGSRWQGIDRSAALAAYRATTAIEPDDAATLADRLTGIRQQIWRRVEAYAIERGTASRIVINHVEQGEITVNEGVIIHGDVTGGNIVGQIKGDVTNAFNTFAASGPPPDVEQAVADLKEQVDLLIPLLADDEAAARKAAKAFETITEAAAETDPVEEIVVGAGKALVGIGEKVQELAGPVATAVNTVLKVLKLTPFL